MRRHPNLAFVWRLLARRLGAAAVGIAVGWAPGPAALAVDTQTAISFVQSVSTDIMGLLRDKPLSERADAFRGLVIRHVATEDVARVVMGTAWRRMSADQRTAYTEALIDYISYSYINQLANFSDQTVEILSAKDRGRRGAFVQSVIGSRGDTMEIIWRVTDRNGTEQILDLYLSGISLIVTQQSDISVLLEKNGGDFDLLIADLRTRAASAERAGL